MTRYLVLGARSPASLELCRGLAKGGHTVFAADSMFFPVTRWSRAVTRYFRLPPAIADSHAYGQALASIVDVAGVDVIIPTCEEVFHLSMARHHLPGSVVVMAEDISKLRLFHDKFRFLESATDCGIGIPRTMLIRSRRRLAETWESLMTDDDVVYKKVYSRFGEGTLVKPSLKEVDRLRPSHLVPWVAQEFIKGEEHCAYAVSVGGHLTAIAVYSPLHRAGKGAGICFESVISPAIEDFVRAFVAKHAFTGQISFDFISSLDRGPFVIECNPRATSGIHLMPEETDWQGVFAGTLTETVRARPGKSMVASAMATYGLSRAATDGFRRWGRDFRGSKDAIYRRNDPAPAIGQFIATAELLLRAGRDGMSALAATTADIEWNGQITGNPDK